MTQAFNGDRLIQEQIENLIKVFGIRTIVETGTFKGHTTSVMADIATDVITIENNETYMEQAKEFFKSKHNITAILGNSPEVIQTKIKGSPILNHPIMFYLDAHWYQYNPLIDELKAIAELGISDCVIVIHDFKVPDKDFGFDKFPNGQEYVWEIIEPHVKKIYGDTGYEYFYNTQAEGSYRGIVYIHPKLS